jgi:hypothetical protein
MLTSFISFIQNPVLMGKSLETFGAFLIAVVGIRAAILEFLVGRHLHLPNSRDLDSSMKEFGNRIGELLELRRRQFSFKEALCVGFGTAFVFAGCGLYLIGLLFYEK